MNKLTKLFAVSLIATLTLPVIAMAPKEGPIYYAGWKMSKEAIWAVEAESQKKYLEGTEFDHLLMYPFFVAGAENISWGKYKKRPGSEGRIFMQNPRDKRYVTPITFWNLGMLAEGERRDTYIDIIRSTQYDNLPMDDFPRITWGEFKRGKSDAVLNKYYFTGLHDNAIARYEHDRSDSYIKRFYEGAIADPGVVSPDKKQVKRQAGLANQKSLIIGIPAAVIGTVLVIGGLYKGLNWYKKRRIRRIIAKHDLKITQLSALQKDMMGAAVLASYRVPGRISKLKQLVSAGQLTSAEVDAQMMWQILAELYYRKVPTIEDVQQLQALLAR